MKLREYLKKNKINYRDFGAKVGVSGGHISNISLGKNNPSTSLIKRIFKATDGQVGANDWVFLGEEPEQFTMQFSTPSIKTYEDREIEKIIKDGEELFGDDRQKQIDFMIRCLKRLQRKGQHGEGHYRIRHGSREDRDSAGSQVLGNVVRLTGN